MDVTEPSGTKSPAAKGASGCVRQRKWRRSAASRGHRAGLHNILGLIIGYGEMAQNNLGRRRLRADTSIGDAGRGAGKGMVERTSPSPAAALASAWRCTPGSRGRGDLEL